MMAALERPGTIDALRAVLASGQHGAAAVTIRNLLPHGHHRDSVIVRAFRRDPSVRYVHRIHEDATASVLALLEREDLALGSVAPLITHLGYLRERAEDIPGLARHLVDRHCRKLGRSDCKLADDAVAPHIRVTMVDIDGRPEDAFGPIMDALFRQTCHVVIGQ